MDLTDPRQGVNATLQLPEKFLMFGILALDSLMVFLEVLHK